MNVERMSCFMASAVITTPPVPPSSQQLSVTAAVCVHHLRWQRPSLTVASSPPPLRYVARRLKKYVQD